MRCVYCYNPDIVLGKGKISFDEVLKFLKSRKQLLDGVVLSGGECTMHKNLEYLLSETKQMGFMVKIDTNGSNPDTVKSLIELKLVDYIALDFKAQKNQFHSITKSDVYNNFIKTLKHLISIDFPFEVRTTIHSKLFSQYDIQQMVNILEEIKYSGNYFLQYFRNNSQTIDEIENSKNNFFEIKNIISKIPIIIRNN